MDYVAQSRIDAAARRLGAARLKELHREIRRQSRARDVFFHYREGKKRFIPIALKPWAITRRQTAELGRLARALEACAIDVFRRRMEDRELAALLPFEPEEERWIRDAYGGRFTRPETLFSRIDVTLRLGRPDWRDFVRLLEVNLVGIGATYYSYSASQIAHDVLAGPFGLAGATAEADLLEMILGRCTAHARKIGRERPTIAFLETRRCLQGPFEYETWMKIANARGHRVVVADPIELKVRGGEIWFGKTRVDIVYRDPTLDELIEMEGEGDDLRAVKFALRRNQVVSCLSGEVDHKGLLEIFSRPEYRRRIPGDHVPWTRILRPARTTDPSGREVELEIYVRKNREQLVIKPNRDYGGHGVVLGGRVTQTAWERALERALARPMSHVAQSLLPLTTDVGPWVEGERVAWRERYLVGGVHATEKGTALLARLSTEPVVNITRGGGIAGVLVAR